MIRLRSDRNVFRSSIRCAEPHCEGLCCPPNSVSSPWKCQICQAERSSQQVKQHNANCCNRMYHYCTSVQGCNNVIIVRKIITSIITMTIMHIRSRFRDLCDMYLARWMSWCALWRRTWKVWSPPEIHSYSSRWSTGMLCSACVTCNLRLDNISVSFKVLGSPGSSSQPLSGCWTLPQPRLCLRSSQAGWLLLPSSFWSKRRT